MIRVYLKYIAHFLILFFIQIFILNNVFLMDMMHPYIYLIFLFMLPLNIKHGWLMLIAFATGLIIDVFSYTYGIHTMAAVLIGFIRPYLLKAFVREDVSDIFFEPHIKTLGLRSYTIYILILILINHFVLLLGESFSFYHFYFTIFKILINTVFTFGIVLLYELVAFYKRT